LPPAVFSSMGDHHFAFSSVRALLTNFLENAV
jgi:hypothetical protein